MAKLRPARCYRKIERPYTRVSRISDLSYVKGAPPTKVRMFVMGELPEGSGEIVVKLISKDTLQIRDNALEAARIAVRNYLAKRLKESEYRFTIVKYPHHVLREHKLANVAKADRFFQGMRLAFGKPIGRAVQIWKGEVLMTFETYKKYEQIAREALKQASYKLPCRVSIVVEERKHESSKEAGATSRAA